MLQYKILTGDLEASVMGDCFTAICLLTRSIEIVEPFLRDDDDAICESAALTLGESRLPTAFVALRNALAHSTGEFRRIILLAIAMTRQPGAVDCLIEVATDSPLKADDAMAALAMYRSDSVVREKIPASQGSQSLQRLFDQHFPAD